MFKIKFTDNSQWTKTNHYSGLYLSVCKVFLFLNQNICCGYSKTHLNGMVLLSTQKHMFTFMDKKILTILGSKKCLYLDLCLIT